MTPAYTRHEAEEEILNLVDWVGSNPNEPAYQAAVLLLLGLGRRKHLDDLVKVSGYSKPFVKSCLANLRQSNVWKGEDKLTWANWKHPLAFVLDVMVAIGLVARG